MPIGMCLGCSFGIFLDNLAMGISLGMLFGVALGTIIDNKKKSDPSEDRPNNDNT